jgi:hypothetical protein
MIGLVEWCIVPLLLWSLVWKGMALWHAAKRDEKPWFVILLIVNTMGILEIIYLLFVAKLFSSKSRSPAKKKRK